MMAFHLGDHEFARKINKFRKQLAIEKKNEGLDVIARVVEKCAIYFERTDSYVYSTVNQSMVNKAIAYLYVNERLFAELGTKEQRKKIEESLKGDISDLLQRVSGDNVNVLHIELADKQDMNWQQTIQPPTKDDAGASEIFGRSLESFLRRQDENDNDIDDDDLRRIWKNTDQVRVFISYCSGYKQVVNKLANLLSGLGISCFVAHRDIHGAKRWRDEIETALHSMDVFLAYLTDNFNDSEWTDQETGFAVSRDVLIIPLQAESKLPYGFIGEFQAKKVNQNDMQNMVDIVHGIVLEKFDGTYRNW